MNAKVTILGSGNWASENGRNQPAFLLTHNNQKILVDCGDGTLQGLEKSGHTVTTIDRVYITHLHPDHVGGLPSLLVARWLWVKKFGRTERKPLHIIGPQPLLQLLHEILESEGASDFFKDYALEFTAIKTEGDQFISDELIGYPFKVDHAPDLDCYGWRFQVDTKTIVFSGDMRSQQSDELGVIQNMKDADLLIIEAGAAENGSAVHLSASEAFSFATRAQAKRVVFNHVDNELEKRARHLINTEKVEHYVEVAVDGHVIEV